MAPVSRVALPLLSRLKEDPQLYRDTYLNMVRIGLSFTMPLMVACMVLAAPMVHFLLGPEMAGRGPDPGLDLIRRPGRAADDDVGLGLSPRGAAPISNCASPW